MAMAVPSRNHKEGQAAPPPLPRGAPHGLSACLLTLCRPTPPSPSSSPRSPCLARWTWPSSGRTPSACSLQATSVTASTCATSSPWVRFCFLCARGRGGGEGGKRLRVPRVWSGGARWNEERGGTACVGRVPLPACRRSHMCLQGPGCVQGCVHMYVLGRGWGDCSVGLRARQRELLWDKGGREVCRPTCAARSGALNASGAPAAAAA